MEYLRNPWRRWAYQQLPPLDDEENPRTTKAKQVRTRSEFSWVITLINFLLAVFTVTIASLSDKPQIYLGIDAPFKQPCDCPMPVVDQRYQNPDMNPDVKLVAGYSPLFDEVDLTPQPTILNGAFHDNTSIYMQDPSPEVDEAWELFSGDVFLTPYNTVRDSGRSLSKSIHFPPSPDGQPGKYVATWDVFHQIHCLNWLRKATNWKYYYGDNKPGPVYLMHQKHCIHMLLQNLMCHADVDIVTFEWMEGHDPRVDEKDSKSDAGVDDNPVFERADNDRDASPAANFNVHKMCRNFSALKEWAEKNREKDPDETRRRLTVPENVHLLHWNDY